jgi:hypothetical protein
VGSLDAATARCLGDRSIQNISGVPKGPVALSMVGWDKRDEEAPWST